jgi:hypothetical protein
MVEHTGIDTTAPNSVYKIEYKPQLIGLVQQPSRLILLKGKVKEKPRRENIYHEGAQRTRFPGFFPPVNNRQP